MVTADRLGGSGSCSRIKLPCAAGFGCHPGALLPTSIRQNLAPKVSVAETRIDSGSRFWRRRQLSTEKDRFRSLPTDCSSQPSMYSHCMLTIPTRLDVMNRLGRAMADPTRSRILLTLLDGPSYPAVLSRELDLSRSNVSNHLACLRDCGIVVAEPEGRQTRYEIADHRLGRALLALVDVTLAVDESAECIDPACTTAGCCEASR